MMIEYKVIECYNTILSERKCNEMGFDGWLLIDIVFDRAVNQYYAYFAREVTQTDIKLKAAFEQTKPLKKSGKRKPKQ